MNHQINQTIASAISGHLPPAFRAAPKRLTADFDSTISGIPCGIKKGRVFVQKPLGRMADSDWDCYGYTDIEFIVLDRHGYAAPWLQAKMTDDEKEQIENEILEYMKDEE